MKERWKKDKKFRKQIIVAILLLVLLLAAAVYTVLIKPRLSTETYVYKEEPVKRGDLILGIMESGSLSLGESTIEYMLNLETEDDDEESEEDGDLEEEEEEEEIRYLEIEAVYAVSGQRVKEGDKLFGFTADSVEAVRRKLSTKLAEAQIALSEAQTDYQISLISAQSTYDSSVKAGSRAESDYRAALSASDARITLLEGEITVLELESQKAEEMLADEEFLESIETAQKEYDHAKEKYEETEVYNATAYVSNLSDYQNAEDTLEQLLEEKKEYEDTIAGNQTRIQEIQVEIEEAKVSRILENRDAENTYKSAKLEGELAEEIYQYSTESLSDTVNQAQTEFDELQKQMDEFEAFVGDDNIIYASENGLVTGVNYEAGDILRTEGIMLTYSKGDEYTVSIDVSEEDIAAVSVGDTVDIVFTAYPEKTWIGTIVSITTTATTEHAATISYPITIHVEGDTELLYGGMTADVTFVTDSVTDVLYVSKKAVFEENGKTYVYKQGASGNMEKAEVETGFADMTCVEIKKGLAEGDIVYIKSIMNAEENEKKSSKTVEDEMKEQDSDTDAQSGEFPGEDFPGGDFQGGFPGGEMPDMGDFGSGFSGNGGGRGR